MNSFQNCLRRFFLKKPCLKKRIDCIVDSVCYIMKLLK